MNLLVEKNVNGLKESDIFARNLASRLIPDDVVLFYGNLGAGKTYLIKKIVENLGIESDVTSPSFSIINEYAGKTRVYHIDLYRIKNKSDLINTGLDEILNSDAIIMIEWPQIIENEFTWPHYRVYIETKNSDQYWRKLSLFKVN